MMIQNTLRTESIRLPNDIWQDHSGYWQSTFIRENLMSLGHATWWGYMARGRGLLVCDVEILERASMNWGRDLVQHQARYIPAVEMPDYLKAQHLEADDVARLMDIVETYRPDGELLTAISGEGSVEIYWLQNLTLSPPDCYQQVCNRWNEFNLEHR
ncbi:MAG: hypothetical protein AAGG02_18200 [Cyanobacteria bacterium P01_H01_bin.15]